MTHYKGNKDTELNFYSFLSHLLYLSFPQSSITMVIMDSTKCFLQLNVTWSSSDFGGKSPPAFHA